MMTIWLKSIAFEHGDALASSIKSLICGSLLTVDGLELMSISSFFGAVSATEECFGAVPWPFGPDYFLPVVAAWAIFLNWIVMSPSACLLSSFDSYSCFSPASSSSFLLLFSRGRITRSQRFWSIASSSGLNWMGCSMGYDPKSSS